MQKASFRNNLGTTIVGNVHFPADFDQNKKYAAIVVISPASGAKEQTSGLWAAKMAEKGLIAIAIDASYQGESGGEPRFKEDPISRVEDIRGAVDYLVTLPYVDEDRIGALGICAGGGYVANAAMTERRIRAVGSVVPVNGVSEMRAGGGEEALAMLEQVAKQRTAEARGAEPMIVPWMQEEFKDAPDIDLSEAFSYYLTPRGQHPNWPNKMRFVGMDAVLAFDAFHLAETFLTQPLQVIAGSQQGAFCSNKHAHILYDRAASKDKDLLVMDGACHFDLYDNPKYVDPAVEKLAAFYSAHLG